MAELVDTILEDNRWLGPGLGAIAERASCATLAHIGMTPARYSISLVGCDDAKIAQLNDEFRAKPRATNVLSWPSVQRRPGEFVEARHTTADDADPEELGDIAIAYETCAREADEAGNNLSDHISHLMVHATLHLIGYDHMDDGDAQLMESLETQILASLGVADPYGE